MPNDVAADARRRVGTAALAFAGVFIFALTGFNLLHERLDNPVWPFPGTWIASTGLVAALLLALAARRGRLSDRALLDLGLGFQVLVATLMALLHNWVPDPIGISPICIVILVYPSIVPGSPRRVLAASLAAATMDPLTLALAGARGVELNATWLQALWYMVPNYICAAMAVVPARIIRGLGRQVRAARELGSYRLGELLGQGGMGEVYRAEHRLLARPAAVKLIRPDLAGRAGNRDIVAERFRREARAAASLRSPHTIHVYDFGVAADGSLFLVMELLDGLDAETLVERFGPLPPERVIAIMRQACSSLAEAHARGLVHRDIKPSNLFVCRLGLETDVAKVLDFGLVGAVRAEPDARLTAPGAVAGTPAFMAPEVALGGSAADPRADVYALGCLAYWLLTGSLVFEGDSPVRIMIRHIEDQPVAPSRRGEFAEAEVLDDIVLACLAKDASARPADAAELGRLLADCAAGVRWTPDHARRWWDTHLPEGRTDMEAMRAAERDVVGAVA